MKKLVEKLTAENRDHKEKVSYQIYINRLLLYR